MSCHNGYRVAVHLMPPCPAQDCNASNDVTMQNVNLTGSGVLDSYVGGAASFRGIAGDGTYTTITYDAVNKVLVSGLNITAVANGFPASTTTVAGKIETSTDAEALAKTSTTVALTPSNLAALGASTSAAGLVELATALETSQGVLSNVAVTPSGLSQAAENYIQIGQSNAVSTSTTINADGADVIVGSADAHGLRFTNGAVLLMDAGAVLNLDNTSLIHVEGVAIPTNSLLGTAGVAGRPTSYLRSDFLGLYSPTQGWTFDGTLDNRTINDSSTLLDLINAFATLVSDFNQLKRPTLL